jgi:hypothetical protein
MMAVTRRVTEENGALHTLPEAPAPAGQAKLPSNVVRPSLTLAEAFG